MRDVIVLRINGNFPIFASEAKLGNLRTLSGLAYNPKATSSIVELDRAGYLEGFVKGSKCDNEPVTREALNGILNYLSNGISYLYERGIAEYSVGVIYPKGAVVTFNGDIYVSAYVDNKQHPTQSEYWNKITSFKPTKQIDSNPIGTIITVPVNYNKEGYIEFVEGSSFNRTIYPELYKVLGTNQFGISNQSVEQFPIGTLLHTIGSTIPDGWIEWKHQAGNLRAYPELLNVLQRIMQTLPVGDSARLVYEDAIRNSTFPDLKDNYLKVSSFPDVLGSINEANLPSVAFNVLPVVLDPSNTLNPLGVTRCRAEQQVISPISGVPVDEHNLDSAIALVGQRTENYFNTRLPQLTVTLGSGNGTEISPKHINTRLIVKARNQSINVPSTHKQLIKAF